MNLVSLFALDKFGYYCSLENCKFSISLNSNFIFVDSYHLIPIYIYFMVVSN